MAVHLAGNPCDMAALVATSELKVETLSEQYDQIRDAAREKLGELFDERDYPSMIDAEFDLGWEFPNLAAPEFLKTMNPVLYEAEKAKLKEERELLGGGNRVRKAREGKARARAQTRLCLMWRAMVCTRSPRHMVGGKVLAWASMFLTRSMDWMRG